MKKILGGRGWGWMFVKKYWPAWLGDSEDSLVEIALNFPRNT